MLQINNLVKFKFSKKSFSTVAKKVLSGENRSKETVSLAFVGKEEIRKINKKFRHKNSPTDVLSFEIKEGNLLGELVICPAVVGENAKKYGVSEEYEMMKIFIHGVLHLCGYDHERSKQEAEAMERKQEKYLSKGK